MFEGYAIPAIKPLASMATLELIVTKSFAAQAADLFHRANH